jgi:hypothetical protein
VVAAFDADLGPFLAVTALTPTGDRARGGPFTVGLISLL